MDHELFVGSRHVMVLRGFKPVREAATETAPLVSGWIPTRRRPVAPLKALAMIGDSAALESARIADLEERPRWNSVLKPTKPLPPIPNLHATPSGRQSENTNEVLTARRHRPSELPNLFDSGSRSARQPSQRKSTTDDVAAALLTPSQVQKDLGRFEDKVPYSDDDDDDNDTMNDDAPPVAVSSAFRGGRGKQASVVFQPLASLRRLTTTAASNTTKLDRLADPLFGLLVGATLASILDAYKSIESDSVRRTGLTATDFRRMLERLLPDFPLSDALLSKAFARYARCGGVEGDTMPFDVFFVSYGQETSSSALETNLRFFFDVLGDGSTISCSHLTSAGLDEFIKATLKFTSARTNWIEVRDALHNNADAVRWAVSRLLPPSSTDSIVLEKQASKRTVIERKLLGDEPAKALPRLSLYQLRFVVYAVTPVASAMRDLWFPR